MGAEAYPKVLVRSEQSSGRVGIVESVMPAGATGPPLHKHDFDEAFYVIEGELTFLLDGELVQVGAGGLAFAPGGVPHTLTNRGSRDARYVLICTPADSSASSRAGPRAGRASSRRTGRCRRSRPSRASARPWTAGAERVDRRRRSATGRRAACRRRFRRKRARPRSLLEPVETMGETRCDIAHQRGDSAEARD
jgi:quercetin dioxygenase-like cupin family protein